MSISVPGAEEGQSTSSGLKQDSDLLRDLKSLFATVFPSNFLGSTGPSRALRLMGLGVFFYGLFVAVNGIAEGSPFAAYDYSVFYILAALPTFHVAALAEGRR